MMTLKCRFTGEASCATLKHIFFYEKIRLIMPDELSRVRDVHKPLRTVINHFLLCLQCPTAITILETESATAEAKQTLQTHQKIINSHYITIFHNITRMKNKSLV